MSDFFTWETLATVAGATAATAYITQFLKKFSAVQKLNTQGVSYLVALVILYLATYFTGTLTVEMALMVPLNAIIVAFSSNGAYDSVKSTVDASVSAVESVLGSVKSAIATITNSLNSLAEIVKGKGGAQDAAENESAPTLNTVNIISPDVAQPKEAAQEAAEKAAKLTQQQDNKQ